MTRSGLIGAVEQGPVCGECLLEEAPTLGWAFALAEKATTATGGRWPTSKEGTELKPILELIEIGQCLGPLTVDGTEWLMTLGLFELAATTVKRQVAGIIDRLETLGTERGLRVELDPALSVEELFQVLGRLSVSPRDFFAGLWQEEPHGED